MKALIVDDSAVMRKIVINAIAQMGITDVGHAADGQEAVKEALSGNYDLVLLDWNMPNMLGIDALKVIRAKGITTPVIMVTTEAEKSRILEAIKSGANNYVVKPFQPEHLIGKIKDTLAKAGTG
ncbi:response regulator [bacterium]|nr:response regulator [bacterium]